LSQLTEEKDDPVHELIRMAKQRDRLLNHEEGDEILPAEAQSPEELEGLLSTLEGNGIDLDEDVAPARAARGAAEPIESPETAPAPKDEFPPDEVELDLSPGAAEKTEDPVRLYLREMGSVPLLKREGEVAIAKRIEHGQRLVAHRDSRAPQDRRGAAPSRPVHQGNCPLRPGGTDRGQHRKKDSSHPPNPGRAGSALREQS